MALPSLTGVVVVQVFPPSALRCGQRMAVAAAYRGLTHNNDKAQNDDLRSRNTIGILKED
jgi:hypothetical protein